MRTYEPLGSTNSSTIRFTRSGREDGDRRLNSVAPCQSHSIQRVLMLVHIVRAWGNLMASNGDMSVNEDRITTQPLSCSVALRRSEEHTSELQSLMRISYAVFCLKKKKVRITQVIIYMNTNNHEI